MTLGNDNGTDGRTDRVQRNMRPPPREEGRIIKILNLFLKLQDCPCKSVEMHNRTKVQSNLTAQLCYSNIVLWPRLAVALVVY